MTQQKCRTLLRRPPRGRKWSRNLQRKYTQNRKKATENASSLSVRTQMSAILLAAVSFNALGDNLCSSIVRPDLFFIQTLAFAFGITNTIVFTNGNHLHISKTISKNDDNELNQFHGKSLYASNNSITFPFISIHALYPSNQSKYSCFTKGSSNKQTSNYIWIQSRVHTLLVFPLRTKSKEALYAVTFFTGSRPVVGCTPREYTLKKECLHYSSFTKCSTSNVFLRIGK